jgi:hypothetical protein
MYMKRAFFGITAAVVLALTAPAVSYASDDNYRHGDRSQAWHGGQSFNGHGGYRSSSMVPQHFDGHRPYPHHYGTVHPAPRHRDGVTIIYRGHFW